MKTAAFYDKAAVFCAVTTTVVDLFRFLSEGQAATALLRKAAQIPLAFFGSRRNSAMGSGICCLLLNDQPASFSVFLSGFVEIDIILFAVEMQIFYAEMIPALRDIRNDG